MSPDNRQRLVIVSEHIPSVSGKLAGFDTPDWPNFFGVELHRVDSTSVTPVMSMRECDIGCGCVSLRVEWAADSSAVRLKGCTTSYRRYGGSVEDFDLLYLPDRDTFFTLEPTKAANGARGALSNNALNPSHTAVTALAQGGKRRAAGRAG